MRWSVIVVISAIFLICRAASPPKYSEPISIQGPVKNFLLHKEEIIVASDSSVLTYNLNGELLGNLTLPQAVKVYMVTACRDDILALICSDDNIYLFRSGLLLRTISIADNYYGIWFDEYSGNLLTLEYPDTDNEESYPVRKETTIMHFLDMTGQEIANMTIPFHVADLLIHRGLIFIDSFIMFEPATYIDILTINGVATRINTTKEYPPMGLSVSGERIYSGGIGLDIWNLDGSLHRHLLNETWVFYPYLLPDDEYIASPGQEVPDQGF